MRYWLFFILDFSTQKSYSMGGLNWKSVLHWKMFSAKLEPKLLWLGNGTARRRTFQELF